MKHNFNDDSLGCSGIYAIICKPNGKVYIGSAVSLNRRLKQHYKLLTRNGHYIWHLQNSWNKHGESAFEFTIIERVADKQLLVKREQVHIDHYPLEVRFNLSPTAGSPLGVKHSRESVEKSVSKRAKLSPEMIDTIYRLRAAEMPYREIARQLGVATTTVFCVLKQPHNFYKPVIAGVNVSPETHAKIKVQNNHQRTEEHMRRVSASRAMYSPEQVKEIRLLRLTGLTMNQIAQHMNIGWSGVRNVVRNQGHYATIPGAIDDTIIQKEIWSARIHNRTAETIAKSADWHRGRKRSEQACKNIVEGKLKRRVPPPSAAVPDQS